MNTTLLRSAERPLRHSLRIFSSFLKFFGVVSFLGLDLVRANPLGEQVVAGSASFQREGGALTVTQDTQRAVINWNSFSIGAGEITRFIQPNASAAVLNRVMTANNPSQIYGTLQANGQVYLINPAGVFVGPGGLVDTASFVASTRDVATEDFMKGGDLRFTGSSDAAILNQGKIEARQGDVFLIARQVSNEGQILASDGTVGMISGTEISLQALGPHRYKVRLMDVADGAAVRRASDGIAEVVNQGVIDAANAELEATGNYLSLAIRNSGTIRATGVHPNADGSVTLTGGQGDLVNQGVLAALQKNVEGKSTGGEVTLAAKNVTLDPGSIVTAAGEEGGGKVAIDAKDTILASGKIEAGSEKGKGGDIVMTGERVGLVKAVVDASGATGGGEILVGGDYLGSNPNVRNAKATVMTSDSVIRANATENGDGGRVILWSDEYTGFYGEIFARGGLQGGDGGFVETSSKFNLQAWGQADVLAPAGKSGVWLLDPYDVYITATRSTMNSYFNVGPATTPFTVPVGTFPGGVSNTLFDAAGQNAEIGVDRILFAINSGQNVIIRTGEAPAVINPAGAAYNAKWINYSEVDTQAGNIYVEFPIIANAASTGSLTLINAWISSGLGGGNIFVNEAISLGAGNLTLIAGDDRGSPLGTSALLLDRTVGGTGGSVFVNAGVSSLSGRVVINAGQSVASWDGGTGGNVNISAPIFGGNGITIAAGAAQNRWNPLAGSPLLPASPEPYILQGSVATAPTRNATGGSITINGNQTITIGNSSGAFPGNPLAPNPPYFISSVASGSIGNNTGSAGPLTVSSPFFASGGNVALEFVTGRGTSGGVLTISSGATIGTTSNPFNLISIRPGGLASVGAAVRANNINFSAFDPTQSLWLNQNEVEGVNTARINNTSLNNLITSGVLSIGSDPSNTAFAAIPEFGDIGIGQAGSVIFQASTVLFQGRATGVALGSSSGPAFSLPSGGTVRFNTSGEIFSNFATFSPDIYVPGGTIDFANVRAPGNNPTQAPGSGTLLVSVANIQGANIVGDAYIQNVSYLNSSGNLNLLGNLTTSFGTVLDVAMPGNLNLTAAGSITQTAGTVTVSGTANFTATGGSISQNGGAMVITGASSFSGPGGISLNQAANNFTGAVTLVSAATGVAAVSIVDQNALTLAIPTLGANTGISAAAGTILTLPNAPFSVGSGNINLRSNGGSLTTAGNLTTSSGTITLVGSSGVSLGHTVTTGVTSGTLTITSTTGAVNQTAGALVIQGVSQVATGNNTISLTQAGNDFTGAVTLANTGDNLISITDANSLLLGNVTKPGNSTLTIFAGAGGGASSLSQADLTTIVTGTAATSGGAFNINSIGTLNVNLSTENNIIRTGAVTLQNAGQVRNYQIRNIASTVAGNWNNNPDPDAGLGTAGLTGLQNVSILYGSKGAGLGTPTAPITIPNQAIVLAGNLELLGTVISEQGASSSLVVGLPSAQTFANIQASGLIELDNDGNDFSGAVSLANTGNNDIRITDANNLVLGVVTQPGTGTVRIAGAATGAAGEYSLSQASSSLISTGPDGDTGGVFEIVAPGGGSGRFLNVYLATVNNVIRTASVTLGGSASQILDYQIRNTASTISGNSAVNPATNPLPAGLTSLRNLSVFYGTTDGVGSALMNLAGAVSMTGNLELLGTTIRQNVGSTLTVPGQSTFRANGDITINRLNNNFSGAVSLATASGGNVTIRDELGSFTLGSLSVGGGLNVTSQGAGQTLNLGSGIVSGAVSVTTNNGNIIQTAALNMQGGLVTLTAGNGLITLGTAGNQISSIRIVSSGNATLGSSTSLDFASAVSTISGNLSVTAAGITDAARVVVVGNTILNAGTGNIVLDNETNDYGTGLSVTAAQNTTLFVPLSDETILGAVTSTGEFLLRTGGGTSFRFPQAVGTGDFDLTTAQLQGFSVGTFTPEARGGGGLELGTFTSALFSTITSLNLVTTDNGTINGNGPIALSAGNFRFTSDGAARFFNTVTAGGAVNFTANSTARFDADLTAQSLSFTSQGASRFDGEVTVANSAQFTSASTATFNDRLTAGSLSFNSAGAVDFNAVNAVQNLGTFSVTAPAPLDFQNNQSLNLTGAGALNGRLSMEVAGYFNNLAGESPLSGVTGGSVIKSLSLFGPSLSNLYGLAGFTTRYDGVMPTTGNVMSYAVSPLVFTIPSGVTIAGVNLGGLPAAGQQLNTFETGSNDLNWMVSDFASFNLPQAPRAQREYSLYPQRVEAETRTLPAPALGQLQRELGRPPTLEEVQAREVARRDAERVRQGAILERSSFDLPEEAQRESFEEAKEGVAPSEGNVPQADGRGMPDNKTAGNAGDEGNIGPQARKDPKNAPGSGETMRPSRPSRTYADQGAPESVVVAVHR